jgi:hypothetical protein
MRRMRGGLWRASNVCQRPLRKTLNQAVGRPGVRIVKSLRNHPGLRLHLRHPISEQIEIGVIGVTAVHSKVIANPAPMIINKISWIRRLMR